MKDDLKDNEELYNLDHILTLGNGDVQFVQKMISLFIEHTPASIKQIRNAYKNKDFNTLSWIAHKIKPSINSLKINNISEVLLNLSKIEKSDFSDEEVLSMIDSIELTVREVVKELKKEQF